MSEFSLQGVKELVIFLFSTPCIPTVIAGIEETQHHFPDWINSEKLLVITVVIFTVMFSQNNEEIRRSTCSRAMIFLSVLSIGFLITD